MLVFPLRDRRPVPGRRLFFRAFPYICRMSKFITIISLLFAAFLFAGCNKEEEIPGDGLKTYSCEDSDLGIKWSLRFYAKDQLIIDGLTSKGCFSGLLVFKESNNTFTFVKGDVLLPADVSPSDKNEIFHFDIGNRMSRSVIVLNGNHRTEGSERTDRKRYLFL